MSDKYVVKSLVLDDYLLFPIGTTTHMDKAQQFELNEAVDLIARKMNPDYWQIVPFIPVEEREAFVRKEEYILIMSGPVKTYVAVPDDVEIPVHATTKLIKAKRFNTLTEAASLRRMLPANLLPCFIGKIITIVEAM